MLLSGETGDLFPAMQDWLRSSLPIDESDPWTEGPPVSFVDLWQRLAAGAMEELAGSLPTELAAHYRTDHPQWGEYAEVRRDLRDDLVTKLSAVAEPAIWQRFNRARAPGDVVMAHLGSQGRRCRRTIYCGVLEELRRDGLESLTSRYPMLRRHLSATVVDWRSSSREILTRVHRDRELLAATCDFPVDARLIGIRQNLSDPHRGGRTVAVLTFGSDALPGGVRAVLYKPKDVHIDQTFQHMISEIPAPTPADGPLQCVTVIARTGYGYMEHVPHEVCVDEQQLRSFYRNAGRLTAILYLLGCNDAHNENLIAHGDQLLLVDAETLFQGTPYERNTDQMASSVRNGLYDRISNSVVRTGLLPQWDFVGDQRAPHDVSALGIEPPQRAHRQQIGWIALNTDGMVAGRVERPAHLPTSLPVGIGGPNRLGEFVEDYCDGFSSQLVAIAADKHRWLGGGGYLARFRKHRSRFVRRATWVYLWVRAQLTEPEWLGSGSDQRRLIGALAQRHVAAAPRPGTQRLYAAEAAQLENLDVPLFEQSIDGVDLIAGDGSRIADFFEVSGYDNAFQRLQWLDAASIEFQLALIRGVIAAKGMRAHRGPKADLSLRGDRVQRPSLGERLDEAAVIGDHLVSSAVTDDTGAVEWLAIHVAEDLERSSYGPLGQSLYSGRSGIALFLAALAREGSSHGEDYRRTALGACSDLQKLLTGHNAADDGRRWWRDRPLGLSGSGGVVLALIHLQDLLPDFADFVADGLSPLLDALDPELVRSDERLDVVFGCAGLIGPLLKIGTPRALSLALQAGDRLVERQDACGGWVIGPIGPTALTGFSHGASGMAAALAKLHAVTGETIYLEAAAKAVRYERRHFDPRERNWPDFREPVQPERPRFMLSWCHGAPGVALSRLCMSQTSLWDRDVEEDFHHALESTADQSLPEDSLCCGRFGRAVILRLAAGHMAARHEAARRWLEAAVRLEGQGLARRRANGGYSFQDVPGLFQGTAGVGLVFLEGGRGETFSLLPSILSAGLYNIRHAAERGRGALYASEASQ